MTRRIRMTDFSECDYAVLPYLSAPFDGGVGDRRIFRSRHGLVEVLVYPQSGRNVGSYRFTGLTSFLMISSGRTYARSWEYPWPPRTLARLAREFARDVVIGANA